MAILGGKRLIFAHLLFLKFLNGVDARASYISKVILWLFYINADYFSNLFFFTLMKCNKIEENVLRGISSFLEVVTKIDFRLQLIIKINGYLLHTLLDRDTWEYNRFIRVVKIRWFLSSSKLTLSD